MKERTSVFTRIPAWKTYYKRAVLWCFERGLISVKTTQRLLDAADARLA